MVHNRALHHFAVFTAFSTFCLIIVGGLVTSTESGLAVPDWPLSYGMVMPPMVGGIFYEHSHRMVASFVGLLTLVLAVWLWRREERRWMKILGVIALAAVIVQGILGGLTVLFLLPTLISVSHATLAQTFFSLVVALAFFTSRWWRTEQPVYHQDDKRPSLVVVTFLTIFAVYVQLILGAVMRHTQAGLAVPDFPLAYGQIVPSLSSEALTAYNQQLVRDDIRLAADGPITSGQVLVHMLHRFWAVVVMVMVGWTSLRLRKISNARHATLFSSLLLWLLAIQVALGAWTILSLKSVEITTAHVAAGSLLLALCVVTALYAVKIFGVGRRVNEMASAQGGRRLQATNQVELST